MSTRTQGQILVLEAFDLISSTTILGAFYGVAFTLYCLCARSLYLQLQEVNKQRHARFTLGYISVLLFFTTIYLVLNTRIIQLAYINHTDFPGGPLGYETSNNSTLRLYATASAIFDLIVKVMMMAIQIWRVWVIWSGVRYAAVVTAPPLLLLFSYIALDVPTGILPTCSFMLLHQLGVSDRSFIAMVITKYVVLSALTILVTGMVIGRILLVRKRFVKITGASDTFSPYMSIIAMLVESYALESAWSIISAISYGVKNPAVVLFMGADSTIKVIAYFLVAYRVATGRGWTSQTKQKLTSLQWNRGALTATDSEASRTRSRGAAATV